MLSRITLTSALRHKCPDTCAFQSRIYKKTHLYLIWRVNGFSIMGFMKTWLRFLLNSERVQNIHRCLLKFTRSHRHTNKHQTYLKNRIHRFITWSRNMIKSYRSEAPDRISRWSLNFSNLAKQKCKRCPVTSKKHKVIFPKSLKPCSRTSIYKNSGLFRHRWWAFAENGCLSLNHEPYFT